MITVKQSYNFPGSSSASTVSYTMSSNNSCVGVTPASGTVSPGTTVEFTFQFQTEACFATQFTLSTYDDVCAVPVSTTFSIANTCSTLDATVSNTPSISNPFIYTVVPSGGNPGYTVEWEYNTTIFNLVAKGTTGFKLELSLKSSKVVLPTSTVIKAHITDENGCTKVASYTYTFCVPVASNAFVTAQCITSQSVGGITAGNGANAYLQVSQCAGTTTDWSTLNLSYDTTKLYVTNVDNYLTIYGVAPTVATTYPIVYSVANSIGITSTEAIVTVSLPVCSTPVSGPTIATSSTKLLTADSSGTVKTLAVDDITFSAL